jgi:hypothetical protein
MVNNSYKKHPKTVPKAPYNTAFSRQKVNNSNKMHPKLRSKTAKFEVLTLLEALFDPETCLHFKRAGCARGKSVFFLT